MLYRELVSLSAEQNLGFKNQKDRESSHTHQRVEIPAPLARTAVRLYAIPIKEERGDDDGSLRRLVQIW